MKNLYLALFIVIGFSPTGKTDDIEDFESNQVQAPVVLENATDESCGDECNMGPPVMSAAGHHGEIPNPKYLDPSAPTTSEQDQEFMPERFLRPDDDRDEDTAGGSTASDDGTTGDIVKAGATEYIDPPVKCDACERDAAYAALDVVPGATTQQQDCEMKDEDNNCVFGSGDGESGSAK